MNDSEPNRSCDLLAGKKAVVTGSSSGIGRAIALQLAAAGADVVVHARARRDRAEEVVCEIGATGRRATVLLADFSATATCGPFVEQAWQWLGGIDIWVNNAGADVLTGAAAQWSFRDKLDYLWRTDVLGTIELSRLVGQRMLETADASGDRTILNLGWDQAEQGMAGDSGEMFAAVKGAVMAFTKSLSRSLAPRVRVNCLAPGWIRTAWGEGAPEYWQLRACQESLLQRWGTPEDVAQVARFLVSPAAAFLTGQIILVNGGNRIGYESRL